MFVVSAAAEAQPALCVKDYLAKRKSDKTLGIALAEAERIVSQVADSIGLRRPVVVVPCAYAQQAYAWPGSVGSGVPNDEYIIYNPDWVREVLGKDQVQAIALFGHELGHFLNGDFTVRKNLPRVQQEGDADRFAGCAVARLSGDFSRLEDLFSRLRLERTGDYPDRLTSIAAAKEGFAGCKGAPSVPPALSVEVRFRINQINEVLETAGDQQKLCFDELEVERTVAGSCIRDYLEKMSIVATAFELGGIYRSPGKDDATVWIGTSGYGLRHLPERNGYKSKAFAESNMSDLLSQVPEVLPSFASATSTSPEISLTNLRRLAKFSETDVLADWFKRHQAQGEYKDKYGSAYKVYEVQVDDYGERLGRIKGWFDKLQAEWRQFINTARVKSLAQKNS